MRQPVRLSLVTLLLSVCLGCAPLASPEPDLVITHARLIDGTGAVIEDASILISGDRIQSVVQGNVEIKGVREIDATGKTVLPGLIDVHVHLLFAPSEINDRTLADHVAKLADKFALFLAHGVTTIKSTADPVDAIVEVRERIKRGELLGPRLLVTGPALTAPGGHPAGTLWRDDPWGRAHNAIELETEESARAAVRELARKGVDAIKFVLQGPSTRGAEQVTLPKLSPEIMEAIVASSHRHGLRVTAHTAYEEDAMAAARAGVDGLEHGVTRGRLTDDRLSVFLRDRGVSYVPTLRVYDGVRQRPVTASNLKKLSENGVRIVLGSDTFHPVFMPPGWSTIDEAEWMARAGLTPDQIIQAGTRNAAEHLGMLDQLGTVEPGKFADLIIVNGDPLEDIAALHDLDVVIKGGKVVVETLIAAIATLREGRNLVQQGSIPEAIQAFARAEALDSRLRVDSRRWATLCWGGVLRGFPAEVMTACERSVALSGGHAWPRSGRGIARALTGDVDGAIEDFEAWATYAPNWTPGERRRIQRLEWIAVLRRGENPFTPELLQSLREQ